jgi:type II secretory ATPase GspE/PulE/Tfp pilus assembly ATPase PilB-like protein
VCACHETSAEGLVVPRGCEACAGTGYRGRLAVHELMTMPPALRDAVRGRGDTDGLRRLARQHGLRTLHEDGMQKVAAGLTTREELHRVVPPPDGEAETPVDPAH